MTPTLSRNTYPDKHSRNLESLWQRVSSSVFDANVTEEIEPFVDYVIKLPIPMYSKKILVSDCVGG
jgi:hypothetical protein